MNWTVVSPSSSDWEITANLIGGIYDAAFFDADVFDCGEVVNPWTVQTPVPASWTEI